MELSSYISDKPKRIWNRKIFLIPFLSILCFVCVTGALYLKGAGGKNIVNNPQSSLDGRIAVTNASNDEVISIDSEGNITSVGAGYFTYLGSIVNKITFGYFDAVYSDRGNFTEANATEIYVGGNAVSGLYNNASYLDIYNLTYALWSYNQSLIYSHLSNFTNDIGFFNVSYDSTFNQTYHDKNSSRWVLNGSNIYYNGGGIGVGVSNPIYNLHVEDVSAGLGLFRATGETAQRYIVIDDDSGNSALYLGSESSSGVGIFGGGDAYATTIGTNKNVALNFHTNNVATPRLSIRPDGKIVIPSNIIVGSTNKTAVFNSFGDPSGSDDNLGGSNDVYIGDDLEVDGTMYLTGGYSVIVNSDVAEVLHTISARKHVLCKADPKCFAESYEPELEFGDVVCIDEKYGQVIKLCNESNSKLVVGAVSNTSVINMGNNLKYGYPIAVAGIVYTKVSIENGNIRPSDLLVSASKSGYAMKNNNPQDGTILGKAFDFCDDNNSNKNGECKILMFVALG